MGGSKNNKGTYPLSPDTPPPLNPLRGHQSLKIRLISPFFLYKYFIDPVLRELRLGVTIKKIVLIKRFSGHAEYFLLFVGKSRFF